MSCGLTFQTLPSVVIRKIIEKCRIPPAYHSAEDASRCGYYYPIEPIAMTCAAWRTIALGMLCEELELNLTQDKYYIKLANSELCKSYIPHCWYIPHARKVVAKIDFNEIANGDAAMWLNAISDEIQFGLVRKIYITLFCSSSSIESGLQAYNHFGAFVDGLKQLFSALDSAEIWCKYVLQANPEYWEKCTKLISKLSKKIEHTLLFLPTGLTLPPATITSVIGLSSLYCTWDGGHQHIIQLIHANSASLNDLTICFRHSNDLDCLVVGNNGRYIFFNNLRRLELSSLLEMTDKPVYIPNNYNPFPSLESLSLDMPCSSVFSYILQRDCGTLRFLRMHAQETCLRHMVLGNPLSKSWLTNLETLNINNTTTTSDVVTLDMKAFITLSKIPQKLTYLRVHDLDVADMFVSAALNGMEFKHMSKLTLLSEQITITQVFSCLSAMPNLCIFAVQSLSLDDQFFSMKIEEMFEYIKCNYRQPHNKLRILHSYNNGYIPSNEVVACVIFVAYVSVQLNTIYLHMDQSEPFELLKILLRTKLCSIAGLKVRQLYTSGRTFWQIDRSG